MVLEVVAAVVAVGRSVGLSVGRSRASHLPHVVQRTLACDDGVAAHAPAVVVHVLAGQELGRAVERDRGHEGGQRREGAALHGAGSWGHTSSDDLHELADPRARAARSISRSLVPTLVPSVVFC